MKSLQHFRVKTILNSILVILVLPGVAYGILLYRFKPDLLSGLTWVISEFAFWAGVLILIPKLWGSNYREWLHFDTLKILKAFEQCTYRTLDGIVDKLPTVNQRIDREEFIEANNKLQAEECILITGESGSGKSGMAASLAKNAIQRGIPVLFLDTRLYSKTVNDMADLSYFINVEGNIKTCMEKVAKQVGSFLFIVDQLDSALVSPKNRFAICFVCPVR
jgi:hypothetical protein